MDNHIFRSAIGGFNRQDVTEYIERTQKQAEEAAAALNKQLRTSVRPRARPAPLWRSAPGRRRSWKNVWRR